MTVRKTFFLVKRVKVERKDIPIRKRQTNMNEDS